MTNDREPRSSEQHWFDDHREAVRYLVAQVVLAGSLAVVILVLLLWEEEMFPFAVGLTGWVVMGVLSLGSIWVLGRSRAMPIVFWWEGRGDNRRQAQQLAVYGSRRLFKDAAQVAGWGRGWVLTRDLAWIAVVAVLVAGVIIGGVSIST